MIFFGGLGGGGEVGSLMCANLHLDFHDSNHDIIIQLIYMLHNVANALNGG